MGYAQAEAGRHRSAGGAGRLSKPRTREELASLPPIERVNAMHTSLPRSYRSWVIGGAITLALHVAVIGWWWLQPVPPPKEEVSYIKPRPDLMDADMREKLAPKPLAAPQPQSAPR